MTAITVDAINRMGNHQARGLILSHSNAPQTHLDLTVIRYNRKSFTKYFYYLKWYVLFLRNLLWCDVLHWNGSFDILLLKLTMPVIRLFKKPGLVEYVGGERNPEVEMLDNEYYREIWYNGYEYPYETVKNAEATGNLFKYGGFAGLALPGMRQHYASHHFKRVYKGFQRIDVSRFVPAYPDRNNVRPLLIHSPTAPIAKGTAQILEVVEELKKELQFDFKLVQGVSHAEALSLLMNADIFIDQIKLGHYGMASLESMASGKPTVCYIKKYVLENDLAEDMPVVNASIADLKPVLRKLISNPALRNEYGKRSRQYVELFHDVKNAVPMLIEAYKQEIAARKSE